jgi:hypothetical protein
LLLGDIAHFLYNLDDTSSYELAVENYSKAIDLNPNDYRCYWFLGVHYSMSNGLKLGVDNFIKAQQRLPDKQSADFWNEYAWCMASANLPTHCIYAMDKVKKITGKAGYLENKLGKNIHERLVTPDKTKTYKRDKIWDASKDSIVTFTCRPLGIKLLIDSIWNIEISDYTNNQSFIILNPSTLKAKNGNEVHYTIAVLMKAVNNNETLDSYIDNLISKYPSKNKMNLFSKYDNMTAYELKNPSLYKGIGGGHFYMIGIERNKPLYSGIQLEMAHELPSSETGGLKYYSPSTAFDRFNGKIFYAIMLDTAEDVFNSSAEVFKKFFEDQLIIE